MAVRKIAHPSVEDRKAKGLEARDRGELSSHTKWKAAADQPRARMAVPQRAWGQMKCQDRPHFYLWGARSGRAVEARRAHR
jgi:hypothetical protein